MAGYTAEKTWAVGDVLTASDLNTYVRDNITFLGSTVAAVNNTSGGVFGGVSTFGDLVTGGVGPSVSAVTGTKALVIIEANLTSNTAGDTCAVGYDVSGATTIAADVTRCLASSSQPPTQCAGAFVQTGLTAGTNTFTLRYYANAAPANFANRNLIVMPLP
jgi:hypothetical protein